MLQINAHCTPYAILSFITSIGLKPFESVSGFPRGKICIKLCRLWMYRQLSPPLSRICIHSQSCHPGVGTWLITSSELHWSDCNNDKILSTGTSGVDSAPSFWLQLPPIVYPAFNCSFILSQQVIVAFNKFNIEIVFLVSGFWCNSLRTWNKMTLSMTICHGYNLNKPIFYIYI